MIRAPAKAAVRCAAGVACAAWIAASSVGLLVSACRKTVRPSGDDGGPTPPSCAAPPSAGAAQCGPDGDSCCASPRVPGGAFSRSYDGAAFPSRSDVATVSPFRLDRYEVTVGRFRRFVRAVVAGYAPAAGSGKHAHLNDGRGLNGGTELGWDASWNTAFARTGAGWDEALACDRSATWTDRPTGGDARPINCVSWTEAYAFCIWDGGFLPAEAEWNDAASGGDEQRVYPWSRPPESSAFACSYVGREVGREGGSQECAAGSPGAVGSASPRSDARWGQAGMAGSLWEWTLDIYEREYVRPCSDCADLAGRGGNRAIRGGSFRSDRARMLASFRYSDTPSDRFGGEVGVRCARAP
ncbi:MAG TPA: SUMF1/EgtB/PvdO family nonheme iron enzyme [Polyangiaceae bacterium]|nr:SUMF1/EgtB/PvdO family nonheme iron enzyme [Polyangiaceae bacterium]